MKHLFTYGPVSLDEAKKIKLKETEIGPLPNEWEVVRLGEMNTKKREIINPSDYPDEIFEYYSIPAYQKGKNPLFEKGANIRSQKILLDNGTVLFGKLNPRVEKVWIVDARSKYKKLGSTEWIAISPDLSVIDFKYLYYLQWSKYVMPIAKTIVTGSTPSRQRVDSKSFYSIKIPLPPLPDQHRIASILSTIDQKIELEENKKKALDELFKSILHNLMTAKIRVNHLDLKV